MTLFHFSEDPRITLFKPKEKQNRPNFPAVVWAIDEGHQFSYYFPRNCPRIICTKDDGISAENDEKFFGRTTAATVVTVESDWYARMADIVLYRYHFDDRDFELFDRTAGYYISHRTIKPLAMDRMDRLIDKLIAAGVELRFAPNLHPLRNAILDSDFQGFGIHRFANAKPLQSQASE
jgi:Family of unknown function (DUF6886)